MGKAIVCQEAEVECQFGNAPDKIISVSPNDQYVNDADSGKKMIVSTKDIGQPFQKKTFGKCSKQGWPQPPCKPEITEWKDFYEAVTLNNGGNPILENSKAVCAIAGTPCVSITFHGQTAEATKEQEEQADEEVIAQINPLAVEVTDEKVNHNLNILS